MNKIEKKGKALIMKLEGEKVTSGQFLQAVKSFFGLLDNVSNDVIQMRNAITWIVEVDNKSLDVIAYPESELIRPRDITNVMTKIRNGLQSLETTNLRPEYFSDTSLRHAKDLASIFEKGKGNSHKIQIIYAKHKNSITDHIVTNIEDILGAKRKEDGSVEGRVVVMSDRTRFTVYIDDVLTGESVRCIAKKDKEDELISAFRKRVVAIGKVAYRHDGVPVSIEVEELRILEKKEGLPTFEDVRGILDRSDK